MWFSSGQHCLTVGEGGEAAHDSEEVLAGGDTIAGACAMEESGMVVQMCHDLRVASSRCDYKCGWCVGRCCERGGGPKEKEKRSEAES